MSVGPSTSSISLELIISVAAITISLLELLWTHFKVLLGIEKRMVSLETKTEL